MTNHSILNSGWTDLVFEGRNQEYGAYQLRRENQSTTIRAFITALALLSSVAVILLLAERFKAPLPAPPSAPALPEQTVVIAVVPPKTDPPKTNSAAPPLAIEEPSPDVNRSNPVVTTPTDATPTEINAPSANTDIPGTDAGVITEAPGNGTAPEGPVLSADGPDTTVRDVALLDKLPIYPGGIDAFRKEIARKFIAPSEDLEQGKTLVVLVTFVIELDGTLTDIRVLRNPGQGMDKEAIRVLKAMSKKWEPGLIRGKPVRTLYKLPIRISNY